jgi:D-alanyl-D-alanine dipeptidase
LAALGVAALMAALAQAPPKHLGPYLWPDLVEVVKLDPTIRLDIKYATADNFTGRAVYDQARAFLQRPAAEALVRAHRALKEKGFGLVILDAYRPLSVTRLFWEVTPPEKRAYVANPKKGSVHNRGCAVDVTLCDFQTSRQVEMPSAYDEFGEAASPTYAGGSASARANRDLLMAAMKAEGFSVRFNEWWHFDYKDGKKYPILNAPFVALE